MPVNITGLMFLNNDIPYGRQVAADHRGGNARRRELDEKAITVFFVPGRNVFKR